MKFSWWRARKLYGSGCSSDTHIQPMPIIVGSPRSGTTLLRFMLDAHPELAIPPETGFLRLGPQLKGRGDKLRKRFFRAVVNYPESFPLWPDFEVPEEIFWDALTAINPFTVPEGYRAFYRLYAARFGKARWGDKTPLYCFDLPVIRKILPEARFIHIIRDGRDAALSLRHMWFSPGYDIETQASYWRECVLAARRSGTGLQDYLEIRFEDLILNTRETLKQICSHISLSCEDAMLSYYKHTPERLREHKERWLPDGTLLTQEQRIRQQERTTTPPIPACAYAWKLAMNAQEIRKFHLIAGDLLEELGYEV